MNRIKRLALLVVALLFVSVFCGYATPVYADDVTGPDQTDKVTTVGDEIDKVWQYIDDNSDKPENEFYPGFVEVATKAEANISDIYNNVTVGVVTDAATADIALLQQDIENIRDQLERLRQAAINQDNDQFEIANDQLGDLVDSYNSDVDAYNVDLAGGRTLSRLLVYAGVPAVVFMLLCAVLGWAWLSNEKSQDVGREIKRRLRWYMVYAMAAILVTSGIPCILYFATNLIINIWYWLPAIAAAATLLVLIGWYIKVIIMLKRRQSQTE